MKKAPVIYVCERGFVIVGRPREQKRGDDARFVFLDDCAIVRVWGTTEGLGQLAVQGPLPDTKLDKEPDGTEINTDYIYRRLPCDQKAWLKW